MDEKNSKKTPAKPVNIQVHVPEELRPAKYANLVNIDASDEAVTLDFIFVNPRDNPSGTLVTRVVVDRSMLKRMTDTLVDLTEVVGRK